jgi:hypothetical protein
MPRYVIRRALGPVSDEDLMAVAEASSVIREEQFPDLAWVHTHVVRDASGGLTTFCVYDSPDPQRLRDHAAAAGMPADEVLEVAHELSP